MWGRGVEFTDNSYTTEVIYILLLDYHVDKLIDMVQEKKMFVFFVSFTKVIIF